MDAKAFLLWEDNFLWRRRFVKKQMHDFVGGPAVVFVEAKNDEYCIRLSLKPVKSVSCRSSRASMLSSVLNRFKVVCVPTTIVYARPLGFCSFVAPKAHVTELIPPQKITTIDPPPDTFPSNGNFVIVQYRDSQDDLFKLTLHVRWSFSRSKQREAHAVACFMQFVHTVANDRSA